MLMECYNYVFGRVAIRYRVLVRRSSKSGRFRAQFLGRVAFVPYRVVFCLQVVFLCQLPATARGRAVDQLVPMWVDWFVAGVVVAFFVGHGRPSFVVNLRRTRAVSKGGL